MRDVRGYDVFRLSDELVLRVYRVTGSFPRSEVFGLVSQMRRASASIPMNLVEGAARRSAREFARYVDMALGSCEEVRYQVHLARALGYLSEPDACGLEQGFEKVKQMLTKLLASVTSRQPAVPEKAVGGRRSAESEKGAGRD